MLKRNKKLFSIIISATLLSSYTTTNILPITVLANEIENKKSKQSKAYSEKLTTELKNSLNKLPKVTPNWSETKEVTNKLTRTTLALTEENFYSHLSDEKYPNLKDETLFVTLKNKLGEKDIIADIKYSPDKKSSKITIISRLSLKEINTTLAEILKTFSSVDSNKELDENFGKDINIEFKQEDTLGDANKIAVDDSNVKKEVLFKRSDSDYSLIGDKIPSGSSLLKTLELEIVPSINNLKFNLEKSEVLALYVNGIELSLDNIDFSNFSLDLSKYNKDNSFTIKALTKNNLSNKDKLYDIHEYELKFDVDTEKPIVLNPSDYNLDASQKTANLLFNVPTSPILFNETLIAEIAYMDTSTAPDILPLTYNKDSNNFSFNHNFEKSKVIKDIKLYCYDDNFVVSKIDVKLPITFGSYDIDSNNIVSSNKKDALKLNINDVDSKYTAHYLVGISDSVEDPGFTNSEINLTGNPPIDLETLTAMGFKKNGFNNFVIKSVKENGESIYSTYKLNTFEKALVLSLTDESGNTITNNSTISSNNPNGLELNLNSNHNLKKLVVTLNDKKIINKEINDTDFNSIVIPSSDLATEGTHNLKIEATSRAGVTETLSLKCLWDKTAPTIAPIDDSSIFNFKANTYYLKNGKTDLSFKLADNIPGNTVKITENTPATNGEFIVSENTVKFKALKIGEKADFNVKITDNLGNSSDVKFSLLFENTAPTLTTKFPEDSVVKVLGESGAPTKLYVKKHVKNVLFDVEVLDDIAVDESSIEAKVEKTTENKDSIKISKPNSKDAISKKLTVSMSDIQDKSETDLIVTAKDLCGNTVTQKFKLIKNENGLTDNSSAYGTDKIKIHLSSESEDDHNPETNYSGYFHNMPSIDLGTTPNILQISNKIKNDTLTLKFEKDVDLKIEDVEVNYDLNFSGKPTSGELKFKNQTPNTETVKLKFGENKITYTVKSINGDSVTKTLFIYYDPYELTVDNNLPKENHNKSVTPNFSIVDRYEEELESVNIYGDYNDVAFEKFLNGEALSKLKETIEGGYQYTFNGDASLPDGKYNFTIEAKSNFGRRRSNDIIVKNSFVLDTVSPVISENAINNDDYILTDSVHHLKKDKNKLEFSLTDNLDFSNLKLLSANNQSGARVYLENNKLIIADIPQNTHANNGKHIFNIALEDIGGNKIEKTITVVNDSLAPTIEILDFNSDEVALSEIGEDKIRTLYLKKDSTNLTLKANLTDNLNLPDNNIKLSFTNTNSETINVPLKKRIVNKTVEFDIDTTKHLSDLSKGELLLEVLDSNGNKATEKINIIKNNYSIENNDSVYKTNSMKVLFNGIGEKDEPIYNDLDLKDFSDTDKPLNKVDVSHENFSPILELSDKFKENKLSLKFNTVATENKKAYEKLKLTYNIKNENGVIKSNTIHFNSSSAELLEPITLVNGATEVNYKIESSNGSTVEKTITINYDPADLEISSNILSSTDTNYIKPINPEFKITDKNISELDYIEIQGSYFASEVEPHLFKKKITKKDLIFKEELNQLIYVADIETLPEGKYENVEIIAKSTFGKKRDKTFKNSFSFIVDGTAPTISKNPINEADLINKDNYWLLKANKTDIIFDLEDNNSVSDLFIANMEDIKDCSAKIENGKLIISNLTPNKKLSVDIKISDKAGNVVTNQINMLRDTESSVINHEFLSGISHVDITNPNKGFIKKDADEIKFRVTITDNFYVNPDSLKITLNHEILSVDNDNVTIAQSPKRDSFSNEYEVTISDIKNLSIANLKIAVGDLSENTSEKTIDLSRNTNSVSNDTSIYKSNNIRINLAGNLESGAKLNKNIEDFDSTDKPLNDPNGANLELTDKLTNDMLDLNIIRILDKDTSIEKLKIDYNIESASGTTTGSIDYYANNNTANKKIKLTRGVNKINYVITSTNGDSIKHEIIVKYDPEKTNLVVSNIDKNIAYYKTLTPTVTITDKHIDEVSKVIFKGTFNGKDFNKSLSIADLEKYKVPYVPYNEYKITLPNLPEGHYKNFSVIVESNYGKRRTQNVEFNHSFTVDRTAPTLNLSIFNGNATTPSDEFIKNNGYYNVGNNNTPLNIAIAKENLEAFNAEIDIEKMNLKINEFDSSNFKISESNSNSIDKNKYFTYSIVSTNPELNLSAEGSYNIELTITDRAGNSSTFKTNYTIDKTAPTLEAKTHDKNASNSEVILKDGNVGENLYLNSDKAYIEFTESFAESNKLEILHNGKLIFNDTKNDINVRTIDLSKEGLYEFKVTVTDKAKNKTYKNYKLKVDKLAPSIDTNFFNSMPIFNKTPNLSIAVDSTSKKAKDIIIKDTMNSTDKLIVNIEEVYDKNNKSEHVISNISSDNIYSLLANHKEGVYRISLTAIDRARNKSTSENKSFVIDTTKPKINISSSSINANFSGEGNFDGKHHNVASTTPVVTINDVSTNANDLKFYLNNKEIRPTSINTKDPYKIVVTLPTIAKESIYDLKVVAGDRVTREHIDNRGHSTANLNFALDRTAPTISLNLGSKKAIANTMNYLTNNSSRIIADVQDFISKNQDLTIKTVVTPNNSSSVQNNNYLFSSDNSYHVVVTATDKAGNSSTFETDVTVDTIFPKIEVKGVKNNHYYNKDILPSWLVDDKEAKTTITLNGAPFNGGKITKEGKYKLVITSIDIAGNKSEMVFDFVVDKTAPIINVSGIKNNGLYKTGVKPLITWDDPDSIVNILLNNIEYMGQEINKDGVYTLFVKGVDKAGNATEMSFKFRLNVSAPVITAKTIKHGETYSKPMKLEFNFADTVEYNIFLNGKPYNGEEITEDGTYNVKVVATDEDGNKTEENYTFYMKKDAAVSASTNKENVVKNNLPLILSFSGFVLILLILFFFKKKKNEDNTENDDL